MNTEMPDILTNFNSIEPEALERCAMTMAAKLEARRVAEKALYDALYRDDSTEDDPLEKFQKRAKASSTSEFLALREALRLAEEAVDAEEAPNLKSSTNILVNPDDKTILSVTAEGQVILLGHTMDDDDEMTSERCMVFVDRAMYHIAIDAWLDHKAWYYARDYFGGEGCIIFTGQIKPDRFWLRSDHWSGGLLDGHEEENLRTMVGCTVVKAYTAITFDVDMEHG